MMRALAGIGALVAVVRLCQLAVGGQLVSDNAVWVAISMCWMLIVCMGVEQ